LLARSGLDGRGRIASPQHYLLGLGDDTLDDFGRRRNIMDQPDGFVSGDGRNDMSVALRSGQRT
jgi:hypothetical protein